MDISAGHLITFGAAVAGVAVGYGMLRTVVGFQGDRIKKLENNMGKITGNPMGEAMFTKRAECDKTVAILQGALAQIGLELEGIKNYHIWDLTTNKNMSLKDARDLLTPRDGG